MHRWIPLLFFIGAPLFAETIDSLFQEPPPPTHLNELEEKVLFEYLNHLGSPSTERDYRIASFYIQTGELEKAKEILKTILEKDLDSISAHAQLGFIFLWQKKWSEADQSFARAWDLKPCDPQIAIGQMRTALESGKKGESIALEIECCQLHEPDALFYLGLLNTRLKRLDQAELALQECLRLSPHYRDAYFALASLFVLQGEEEKAEEIYDRFPEDAESDLGRARLAWRNKKADLAEPFFRKALEKQPENLEARQGLAQALAEQLKYTEAKKQYAALLETTSSSQSKNSSFSPRKDPQVWLQSKEVKSHTNWAFQTEINYTDAKEDDPSLRVPVVKDYYFTEKFTLFIPLFDRWRVDIQQIYRHQRENDILNPSVNYSAFLNAGALYSHFFFLPNWKWDVSLKGIQATGIQNANFPFHSSALFEPGTLLMYSSDWNRFVLDAHIGDQIIKNFSDSISQLLRIDTYQGEYALHAPVFLHPLAEVGLGRSYYHDAIHNWKQYQNAKAGIDLLTPLLRLVYLFEHSRFKQLTQNYFTYKRQIQHTLSLKYEQMLYSQLKWEMGWDHIWQSNQNVVLPIGNLIFTSPSLYLIGNRFSALLQYRFQDLIQCEIGAHYFRLTLPYHDWNLHGALHWQF